MPSGGPDRKRSDLFNVIAAVIAAAIFVALRDRIRAHPPRRVLRGPRHGDGDRHRVGGDPHPRTRPVARLRARRPVSTGSTARLISAATLRQRQLPRR